MVTENDKISELTQLVRTLLNTVNTLELSVAKLNTKVERINYISKLLDVTINELTFGDILLYSNDGKWHNILPGKIIISNNEISSITKLENLEDVAISMPTNGLSLVYSNSDNKWHNQIAGGGQIDPSILENYLTKVDAKNTYFPLSGGTINGNVKIDGNLLTSGGITLHGSLI